MYAHNFILPSHDVSLYPCRIPIYISYLYWWLVYCVNTHTHTHTCVRACVNLAVFTSHLCHAFQKLAVSSCLYCILHVSRL